MVRKRSVNVGGDVPENRDHQARELIDQFGAALRGLNGGAPLPARWREWIEAAIGPKRKRGTSPNTYVQERNERWADAMLKADIARARGQENRGRSQVATDLAKQETAGRRNSELSNSDVFKAEARGGAERAIARELTARLEKRDHERAAENRQRTQVRSGTNTSTNPPKTRK